MERPSTRSAGGELRSWGPVGSLTRAPWKPCVQAQATTKPCSAGPEAQPPLWTRQVGLGVRFRFPWWPGLGEPGQCRTPQVCCFKHNPSFTFRESKLELQVFHLYTDTPRGSLYNTIQRTPITQLFWKTGLRLLILQPWIGEGVGCGGKGRLRGHARVKF